MALTLSWFLRSIALPMVTISAILFHSAPARADAYLLDVMDTVRIRVAEWQTSQGTFRDWSSVAGEYTVGPDGTISVPFVGEVEAAGKTTAEIGTLVGDHLQQQFGLTDRPHASVDIVEFRSIYVAGDVRNPGAFPYEPGLTVIKAMSIAGGERRSAEGADRIERDVIRSRGDLGLLGADRDRLLAKKARLQAMAAGRERVEMPEELALIPGAETMIADEQLILEADGKRISLQLAALEDLKELLRKEIETLREKEATQQRQLELARKELEGVGSLADRGLVVNQRVSTLERQIADLEGNILDVGTAALRAEQQISKAEQDAIRLQNDSAAAVAVDLQSVLARLQQNGIEALMHQELMQEALVLAPQAAAESLDERYEYEITRQVGEDYRTIAAEEDTPLQPGDVVKVELVLPRSAY